MPKLLCVKCWKWIAVSMTKFKMHSQDNRTYTCIACEHIHAMRNVGRL